MRPVMGYKITHVCSIPFCTNKSTMIMTRSADVGFGQKVYICAECAKEMAALYRNEAKKKKEDTNGDN